MEINAELTRFNADVNSKSDLRDGVKALGSDVGAITSYANSQGYNFSQSDVTSLMGEGELDEEQLDGVVGGLMILIKTKKGTFFVET
ncbi:MAG: hypothetical protein HY943_12650 [Gammaproteobacteria bacterium]|nr:hypothetical protein [Gammaproteobacteria bacterium]